MRTMQLDAIRDVQIKNAQGWRKLWGQAIQERDPNRLMELLAEINDLLDQEIAPSQTQHLRYKVEASSSASAGRLFSAE